MPTKDTTRRQAAQRLVDHARHAPALFGRRNGRQCWRMSGMERSLLYRLALELELDLGSLCALTIGDFDSDTAPAFVRAPSQAAHACRGDLLVLPPDLTLLLNEWCMDRDPGSAMFSMPPHDECGALVAFDAERAGVRIAALPKGFRAEHGRPTFRFDPWSADAIEVVTPPTVS